MNLLLLIPGLFTILEKVVGPLVAGHASSIASKIMGGSFDGSLGGLMGIIEGTIGQLEDAKRVELQAELQTLLAQCKINEDDAQSNESFFYKGPRPTAFWAFLILAVIHCSVAELFNLLHSLGFNVGLLAPMDNMAWLMLGGLAGIWAVSRGIEKINANDN